MILQILNELEPEDLQEEGEVFPEGGSVPSPVSLFVDDDLSEHLDEGLQALVQSQRLERVLFVRQI
jgi:hypothetical protein